MPTPTAIRRLLAATVLAFVVAADAGAEPPTGSAGAELALAICRAARELSAEARRPRLTEGLALAVRATEEAPGDPVAWFAAFCNRGKVLQSMGIGFSTLGELRRLRREIDTALGLAPEWAEAVAAKGAMLVALPRLLGGDVDDGRRLLRRALALDPTNVEAAVLLGQLDRGAGAMALAIARLG